MAITCNATDIHLYCTGTNFTKTTDPFTVTVWINAVWNGATTLSFIGIFDGVVVTGQPTRALQIGTATGAGEVSCWEYGGNVIVQSANSAMTPFNNAWVLITYTSDGTTHSLYRNSTLLTTSTISLVSGTFTQIYINGYPPTGVATECSTHQIGAYAYYNRALSLSEIQTIYDSQGSRHGIVYGALARYEFDELSQGTNVSSVADLSGNGNTLLSAGAGTPMIYNYPGTIANSNLRMVQ